MPGRVVSMAADGEVDEVDVPPFMKR